MAKRFFYGGQAVIEGVMIRGLRCVSLAVRLPDGSISTTYLSLSRLSVGPWRDVPLVRGILVLLETLVVGIQALNRSAALALTTGQEGQSAPGELPKGTIAGTLGVALALGIAFFFLLPLLAARTLDPFINSSFLSNLLEGGLRLGLLVGYIWAIGRVRDVRRVFGYHGAEHMAVHAYEHGAPLEVSQVARFSPAHPRCGTAFLLMVVVLSILVFSLLGRPPLWVSILSRIVLVPFIAALGYELLRFGGAHSMQPAMRLLLAPSLALQALTTRQPDPGQVEVAIAAMQHALASDAPGPAQVAEPSPGSGASEGTDQPASSGLSPDGLGLPGP